MVKDITDRKPNKALIEQLEIQLQQAKDGEIRSMITISGWYDDSWSSGWVTDIRNSKRRMLAEMSMVLFDMQANISLNEGDSVLSKALGDD